MEWAVFSVFYFLVCVTAEKSFIPDISVIGSSGIRIKLPDEDGISHVIFTVRLKNGDTTYSVDSKNEDVWEYIDSDAAVEANHVIVFRTSVLYKGDWIDTDWNQAMLVRDTSFMPRRRLRGITTFRDDFNRWNPHNYKVEVSAWGGGNGEFEIYTPEHNNIFVKNGYLYLKPTFTVDHPKFTNDMLYHGRLDVRGLWGTCTNSINWGCDKTAFGQEILNPIMSGKVTTNAAIKYGRIVVRAMIPKGDWTWPAIWSLPRDNKYGSWPRSGEIDLMEAKGNLWAVSNGNDNGIRKIASTTHWGTDQGHNKFYLTHGEKYKQDGQGDWHSWHIYSLEWSERKISIMVDGDEILRIDTPSNGYYGKGGFSGPNPWAGGSKAAPFDQPFQLILNVAVGGAYFSDGDSYNTPKPWWRGSPHPMRDFWEKRGTWQPTWHGDDVAMLIDYVEMIEY